MTGCAASRRASSPAARATRSADVAPGSYQLMMVVDGSECQIDFLDIAADQRIDLTPNRLRECITSH